MLSPYKVAFQDRAVIALKGFAPASWHEFLRTHGLHYQPELVCFVYDGNPLPEPVLKLLASQSALDPAITETILNGGGVASDALPTVPIEVEPAPKKRKATKPKPKKSPAELFRMTAAKLNEDAAKRETPPLHLDTRQRQDKFSSQLEVARNQRNLAYRLNVLADYWKTNTVPEPLRPVTTKKVTMLLNANHFDQLKAADRKTLARYGLDTEAAYTATRNAWLELGEARDTAAAARLSLAEAKAVLHVPHFLPTTPDAAHELLKPMPWREGLTILEPFAGVGNLLAAVQAQGKPHHPHYTVLDKHAPFVEVLNQKGVKATTADIMTQTPDTLGTFDRIITHPPFEHGARMLITRTTLEYRILRHMFTFLNPGGRLIALMPTAIVKRYEHVASTIEFMDWLEQHGSVERLPVGILRTIETPHATIVSRVVLDKPTGA
jgi:SAM-dependent methyltransferase